MLIPYENRQIFIATKDVDFRMSIDGLSTLIHHEKGMNLHDGSIYVFFNYGRDKIKCLFWDGNGFVLYYKRLDKCTFKIQQMLNAVEQITAEDLEVLLAGLEPEKPKSKLKLLENKP